MPILKAAARRLRRIYVYLFAAHEAAWIVKLASHPSQAKTLSEIVERAGEAGRVTVATNMAGRGTDIVLGGNANDRIAGDAGRDILVGGEGGEKALAYSIRGPDLDELDRIDGAIRTLLGSLEADSAREPS